MSRATSKIEASEDPYELACAWGSAWRWRPRTVPRVAEKASLSWTNS